MLRRIVLSVIAVATALASTAATPAFDELQVKADRFIYYKEWPSAMAMLQLMADERPEDSSVTGLAIAVAGLLDNEAEQLRLFRAAVDHRQRFDSVFTAVESRSFALSCGHVYERFLRMIAREEPWTSRSIDSYLLRYYTFRRDGEGMVEYAGKMLAGMPDNVDFLQARAEGYMLTGEFEKAAESLRELLKVDPDNLDALLKLGFYLRSKGDTAEGDKLLRKACDISPTPYLKSLLSQQ